MLVFDINWNSVEDLYLGMGGFPSRLLFQVAEWRQARRLGWRNGVSKMADERGEAVFRVRRRMPAGWFITGGFVSMPFLALHARKLAAACIGQEKVDVGVFTSPHYLPLKRSLKPGLAIYHAVDDYAHYWPKRAEMTRRRESQLIAEVDFVVCSGAFLARHLKDLHPDRAEDMHHIPNPVPPEFLADRPTIPPYFEGRRSSPVLGYVGTIDERMDHGAILDLARALPHAEIRIYPAQDRLPSSLAGLPNIVVYPRVRRNELPARILDFDVCLIAQRRTHFNLCASPRKLYEYLGSSRPIVALNTPEAETLGPHVVSAQSSEEFVQAVVELLKRGDAGPEAAQRLDIARRLTPPSLAKRYAAILKQHGGARGAANA